MNFFDRIKEKLFPKEDKPSNKPYHKENLKRKEEEKNKYREWVTSREKKQLLDFIREQYFKGLEDHADQSLFRILDTETSKGFMFGHPAGLTPNGFQNLFDYLAERVKEINYSNYLSDRKFFTRDGENESYVEVVERHFLKPSLSYIRGKSPTPQIYGNVHIEFYKNDDHPQMIKFISHAFNDRNYLPPEDFGDLIRWLTD